MMMMSKISWEAIRPPAVQNYSLYFNNPSLLATKKLHEVIMCCRSLPDDWSRVMCVPPFSVKGACFQGISLYEFGFQ